MDEGNVEELFLLVDIGAEISLLKNRRFLGTTMFEPEDRVRVKSVEGSIIERHASVETNILEGPLQIPFLFQLVSKQDDLLGDGILGRDFLKQMQAQICYLSKTLNFTYGGFTVTKPLSYHCPGIYLTNSEVREARIKLLSRSETIVSLPAEVVATTAEGLIERREFLPGLYLAGSLVKVVNGCVISIEEEVDITVPDARVTRVDCRSGPRRPRGAEKG